ncbi:hypothetical protein ANO11243_036660 [Dothideomycetidae sp. 11243]|nr:hypothetical protein ANO11243_036660 [fungal sp. No.11243]
MVYAAPNRLLLLVLLVDEPKLLLDPRDRMDGREGELGEVDTAEAAVRRGDGGGDGIPEPTSNAPPDPCERVSSSPEILMPTKVQRTAGPASRVVKALQLAGDGIDGVGARLNIGAGGVPLDEITTHTLLGQQDDRSQVDGRGRGRRERWNEREERGEALSGAARHGAI